MQVAEKRCKNKNRCYTVTSNTLLKVFILKKDDLRSLARHVRKASLESRNQLLVMHVHGPRQCILLNRRGGRSLKRAVCQARQLVWTHSVQEEHNGQCFEEQRHMTKCQIYLTANSFPWSETEYMRRISLLQCVWQRTLVFSIIKHVPDDHPCVYPDSEQSKGRWEPSL